MSEFNDIVTGILVRVPTENYESVRDALWKLHVTEQNFLAQDLDTAEILSLLDADDVRVLKALQSKRIRELRTAAYATEFDGLAAGVVWDGDDREPAESKRREIKERYPWPGNYRE